jgi:hypothetical protein
VTLGDKALLALLMVLVGVLFFRMVVQERAPNNEIVSPEETIFTPPR